MIQEVTNKGEAVRTLMTGPASVSYGQIYVESSESEWVDLSAHFGGQRNGLCGAVEPGRLHLVTGLHTGDVGFAVELHETEPPLDDSWEEIVEASFRPLGDAALVGWGGSGHWPLELQQIDYRVRYNAWGMDAGHQGSPPMDGEPLLDRYLLQFWPAPPVPDQIIKVTSAQAAYWHGVAQTTPVPPTPAERAETKRLAALERERQDAELRLAAEVREWGGTLPSDRVRALGWNAKTVAQLDRPLIDAVDRQDAATQRAIARWSARRAFTEAGLDRLDWLAEALDGMDRGEDLPPEFSDPIAVFDRMWQDDQTVHTIITTIDGSSDNFSQQAMALGALAAAHDPDPLRAALETIRTALNTYGFGRPHDFLTALRSTFPSLS